MVIFQNFFTFKFMKNILQYDIHYSNVIHHKKSGSGNRFQVLNNTYPKDKMT